jgi:acetyl-CoA acyltransferase 1
VNRQCSSGLQAFANVAASIRAGYYDIGIAAGVESMSTADMMGALGEVNEKVFANALAKQCLNPMGITSENVAAKFGITREMQDTMAVMSNERALNATATGRFKSEIVPVTTQFTGKDGKETTITVTQDDGPRKGTTVEKLGKLRAAFKKGGTTTAGNSSQVSDGAAAVMLMTRAKAAELNLPIKAVFRSFSAVGVEPEIMGIGPAAAIPAALSQANLAVKDIDIYEINEAFASQATYCVKNLEIPMDKVNPNGGAIALGHPLGCTGARQIATLLAELERTNGRYGVVSMCIGTGMGAAAVFERS